MTVSVLLGWGIMACCDSVPFGRLPGDLLMAQCISPPRRQHGPLDHREIAGHPEKAVLLEGGVDCGNAPHEVERGLHRKENPEHGIGAKKAARGERSQEQEWSTEPQEFMARQLKGKSAIADRIQQIQIGHEHSDPSEERSDLPARFSLR